MKGKVPEHRNGFKNNQSTGMEPAGGTCAGAGQSVESSLQRRPKKIEKLHGGTGEPGRKADSWAR